MCRATKATEGGAPPLREPAAVAVAGSRAVISESINPGRVRVCSWSGLELSNCMLSDFDGEYKRAGGLAIDQINDRVFIAMTLSNMVVSCKLGEYLTECQPVDFGRGPFVGSPVGLTVAHGSLWVAAENELRKCQLTAGSSGSGVVVEDCVTQMLPFSPSGIAIHVSSSSSGLSVLLAETEEGKVWVCDASNATRPAQGCNAALGDGTFFNSSAPEGQESNHPAAVSMDIVGDTLYVPMFFGHAISVCRNAAAAAECMLQAAQNYSFQGVTSVAAVPLEPHH